MSNRRKFVRSVRVEIAKRDVVCFHCGNAFQRYPMNATRAARPQYCSTACFSASLERRAQARFRDRLLKNVPFGQENECWEWTGRRDERGYGRFDYRCPGESRARPQLAHRLVYEALREPIPSGLDICHHCDNPPCCNPGHHFLGTAVDNAADMMAKGRNGTPVFKRGEECNLARLTAAQALEALHSQEQAKDVALRFGVTTGAIRLIRKGKSWSHLSRAAE